MVICSFSATDMIPSATCCDKGASTMGLVLMLVNISVGICATVVLRVARKGSPEIDAADAAVDTTALTFSTLLLANKM